MNKSPIETYQNEKQKESAQNQHEQLKKLLLKSYSDECIRLELPKRDDRIYKDIEVAHKHTYTLVYEMAIRNDKVKAVLYALDYLKEIQNSIDQLTKRYFSNKSKLNSMESNNEYTSNLESLHLKIKSTYAHYLSNDNHEVFLYMGVINKNAIIDDFEKVLRLEYLIIPRDRKIITPESYRILTQKILHNSIDLNKWTFNSNKPADKYKFEELAFGDYTNSIGILEGEDTFDVSLIRPTYSNHIVDKNVSYIPINLTLPIEEITAFIEDLKNNLKENSSIIKTPMELLGEKLEEINEAKSINKFPSTFKNRIEAIANALFSYDKYQYLNFKYTKEKKRLKEERNKQIKNIRKSKEFDKNQKDDQIDILRMDYNDLLNNKGAHDIRGEIASDINPDVETIKVYITFMNEYIQKKKYQRLFIKTNS